MLYAPGTETTWKARCRSCKPGARRAAAGVYTQRYTFRRGLEYGVLALVFYGNLQEQTVFLEFLQEACFVLTEISEGLRKPPGVYGRV